jgi:hypothetical protein
MVDGEFFATQFYADVDGHPDDRNLAFALEELKFFSDKFEVLGVYPADPFRGSSRQPKPRLSCNGASSRACCDRSDRNSIRGT